MNLNKFLLLCLILLCSQRAKSCLSGLEDDGDLEETDDGTSDSTDTTGTGETETTAATSETTTAEAEAPEICTDTSLKEKIDAEMEAGADFSEISKAIQASAVEEFGGYFNVICGAKDKRRKRQAEEPIANPIECSSSNEKIYCTAWQT